MKNFKDTLLNTISIAAAYGKLSPVHFDFEDIRLSAALSEVVLELTRYESALELLKRFDYLIPLLDTTDEMNAELQTWFTAPEKHPSCDTLWTIALGILELIGWHITIKTETQIF